jgi:hypothetical protein
MSNINASGAPAQKKHCFNSRIILQRSGKWIGTTRKVGGYMGNICLPGKLFPGLNEHGQRSSGLGVPNNSGFIINFF